MAESIGNPDAGGVPRRERHLRTAFWVVWAVLLVVKIVLAAQLVTGALKLRGAYPCVGLVTLDDYLGALARLDVATSVTSG